MGSKGSNTTKETQSYQADPRAAAYAQWLSGQAQTLPGQGAVPLQGVEGFSPDQLAAFQGVRNVQGTYNPYAQRAEALNAEYGRGLDFDRVQDYYNQLSAGPLAQLQNQQRAQMAQTTRNAVQQAGGTGASRIGVTQANLANQQNLATGALQSGLLGQSVGAFQNDLAMKGAAAAQEANLGMGHTAQNYNDLGQLYGIGSAQQGLGQSRLNALYQQGMGQYQNPYQNLQYQGGILSGLGNIFKGTETTTKEVPEASPWGTLLGAAGAGLGAYFGGPAGSAALGSLFGGGSKGSGGGYGNSRGDWNPNVPGGRYAVGGAVNPFGGGPRSDLFNQMVKEYFPKNNSMVNPSGIGAGNPFGQMVPGQPAFANGGKVPHGYATDGAVVDDFDTRFGDIPAPDLYDPGVAANRNALRDAGYNSPYRMEPMSEGDDAAPPLPQARPPFEMFPNRNPLRREAPAGEEQYAEGSGDATPAGGSQLPPMPDTGFQAPERNPWGAVINAVGAALGQHGKRGPTGHLDSGTVFGQAARAAGAGLDAGMKTHAAGREEDRKNYEMKLAGERLAEQAAMARLPYVEMTEAQRQERGFKERELALKEATPVPFGRNIWGQPIYAIRDPKTKQMLDTTTGKPVDMSQLDDSEEALRPMATAIANYEMAPLSPYKAATPVGAKIASMIKGINPTWDSKHYSEAQKTINSFATGVEGRTARSMNVAIDHLTLADELGKALQNGDIQAINAVRNAWRTQTGQEAPTNFEAVKSIVGGEVAKAVIGSQYALQDREELRAQLKAASSPAQLAGVIANYKRLMAGQLIGLEKQYQAGTRMNNFRDKYLTPEARKELDGMSTAERSHVTLPPEAQKMLKEGQVTTFGNGQKWTLKNGKPERVQ